MKNSLVSPFFLQHSFGPNSIGVTCTSPMHSAVPIANAVSAVRSAENEEFDPRMSGARRRSAHRDDSPSSDSGLISDDQVHQSDFRRNSLRGHKLALVSEHGFANSGEHAASGHSCAYGNVQERSMINISSAQKAIVSDNEHGVTIGPSSLKLYRRVDYIEEQIKAKGLTLEETIELVLNTIRTQEDCPSKDQMHDLAKQQTKALINKGIDTPEKLCAILRQAGRLDLFTACLHGLANSSGFNGASAFINFLGGDLIAGKLGMNDVPTLGQTALQAGISGMILCIVSAAVGPAVNKTFLDAYYMAPPADRLPAFADEVRTSRMPAMAKSGHEQGILFLKTYGYRNLLRFVVSCMIAASEGAESELISTIDNYLDPIGGGFASMRFGMLASKLNEKQGTSGIPYFLARTDLAECIDALDSSLAEKVKSALIRTATHLGNSATRLPEGLLNSVTTLEECGSGTLLAAGFAGVSVARSLAGAASGGNFVAGEVARNAATAGLYYAYGHGRSVGKGLEFNRDHMPGSKISEGIDSFVQSVSGMELRRRRRVSAEFDLNSLS